MAATAKCTSRIRIVMSNRLQCTNDELRCHLGALRDDFHPMNQNKEDTILNKSWILDNIIQPNDDLLNYEDPKIQQDILRLIVQYLQDEGFHSASMTIMDEANLKIFERLEQQQDIKRMKKAILEGDWPEVDRLCSKQFMKNHKSFLYAAYEQVLRC